MGKQRAASSFSLALRGLLVVALLAIAPVYERAHAMTGTATATAETMSHMPAHDMSAGAMPDQRPTPHGGFDAGCRILCFGWVEAMVPLRPEGQVTEIALVLAPVAAPLRDGIAPDPSGHPPKPASFV